MEISNDIELMNILTWILWGILLAILVPALLLGFTIILNKILLGKDPGTRTYDDIMEAQREKREALIEDKDRPSMLPTDGNKIIPQMLDSKADLQALIDSSEIFRKKKEMDA
jgi:hypothetical protein